MSALRGITISIHSEKDFADVLEEWSISLLSVPRILTTFFCQGRVASPDPLVVEVAAGSLLLRQPVHGRPRFLGAAHVRRHRSRLHPSADADRRLSLPARVHQAAAGKRTRHSVNSAVRPASNAARACWSLSSEHLLTESAILVEL